MAGYKVLVAFRDPEHGCVYNIGDAYPAPGRKSTRKRVAYLMGTENKIGVALLEAIDDDSEPEALVDE